MICSEIPVNNFHMFSRRDFTSQSRTRRKSDRASENAGIRPTASSKGFISGPSVTAKHRSAWIEHEKPSKAQRHSAAEAAEIEEKRLRFHESEKRKRLREFRQAVTERLKENVERQENLYQRIDSYSTNIENSQVIGVPSHKRKIANEACEDNARMDSCDQPNERNKALLLLSSEIGELSKGVRQIMRNKVTCNDVAKLPGGQWYTSLTEDRDSVRQYKESNDALERKVEPQHESKDKNQPGSPNACKRVTFSDDTIGEKQRTARKNSPIKTHTFQVNKPLNTISESRKYYMDMERHKARENIRVNQQREHIKRVKSQKELERRSIEQQLKYCDLNEVISNTMQSKQRNSQKS